MSVFGLYSRKHFAIFVGKYSAKSKTVCQFRGIPQYHEFHITIYHEYATFIVLLMSMVLTADLRLLRVTDFVTEYRMLIH